MSTSDFLAQSLLASASSDRLCKRIRIPRRLVARRCAESFAVYGRLVAATRWTETRDGQDGQDGQRQEQKRELWLLDEGRFGLVTRTGSSTLQSEWDLGVDATAELELLSLSQSAELFSASDMLTLD